MIGEGLKLMFLGMGMVFSFLILLYFGIIQMGRIYAEHAANELAAENAAASKSRSAASSGSSSATDDQSVIAVIGAAVAAFRRDRGKDQGR